MPKFNVGSRFYIHSRDPVDPAAREPGERTLVVISHGYLETGAGQTNVRGLSGVGRCAFFAREGNDADVEEVSAGIEEMARNPQSNGGFYETPVNQPGAVNNYTLVKGMEKRTKGAADYRYVDSIYIDGIYPALATFDIIALHNRWYKSSKVRLSELFATLAETCPGVYNKLYCGFCRESMERAMQRRG